MTALRHTRALLGAVLLLAAADVAVRVLDRTAATEALPSLPAFDPADATRISLGHTDETTVMALVDGSWRLMAPADAPADPGEVGALLGALSGGIRPEAKVDDTDHERYGLAGGTELRVDVEGQGPLLSVVVGNDAGGGSTWVRYPNSEDVYRARIGGRSLVDRPAGAWRDRRVTDVEPETVRAVEVAWPGGQVSARRAGARWEADPPVDAPTVERLVVELARLRAAEVAAADREVAWDLATVRLAREEGDIVLVFGRRGPLRYVRRLDRDEVWRLAVPWVDRLAEKGTWLDRAVWTAARVDRIAWRAPGRDGILQRTDGGWKVVRPANVDVDPSRAEALAAFFAEPRVARWEDVEPAAAGFPSAQRFAVEADGDERVLEVGLTEADRTYVRDASTPSRIGSVESKTIAAIAAAFGG